MKYEFKNAALQSNFFLSYREPEIKRYYNDGQPDSLLTIAWNRGKSQKVIIDEIEYDFPSQLVLPLMANDTFQFSNPQDVIAWQFNKDFYCIIDHDKEVSCAGFIFHGNHRQMAIRLDEKYQKKLEALLQVFIDEFEEHTSTQEEMLRMLLKRLIILITRLGKQQFMPEEISLPEEETIRKFNVLVEENFKKFHQVQDYANLLNKAPKTLSNHFAKFNSKTPLQIIHNRIILEAKRQLYYTDKTFKEIAFHLGFEDPTSFSRFFKKYTKQSPSAFKQTLATNE